MAYRSRDTQQRSARAEESVRGDRLGQRLGKAGDMDNKLATEQPTDAREQQGRAAGTRGDVVVLGPGGDRHTAERVPGDDRSVAGGNRRV